MTFKYLSLGLLILGCYQAGAKSGAKKIKSYYALINKAELSIVDSNYGAANNFYKEAFQFKNVNDKDLFNAEIVSYMVKDTTFAIQNLNALANYGMKKMVFEGSNWGETIKNDSFYHFISKDYDSTFQKGERSPLANYGKQLLPFYEKDQTIRMRNSKATKEERTRSDKENIIELQKFIGANGFPSFQRTGFFDKGGFSIQMFGTFYLLLWHTRPSKTTLDKIMYDAVIRGEFSPEKYAFIIDHRNDQDSNKYNIIFEGQPNLSKQKETEINKERAKIYLEPLEDFKKKFAYCGKDNRFELIHPTVFGENMLVIKLR